LGVYTVFETGTLKGDEERVLVKHGSAIWMIKSVKDWGKNLQLSLKHTNYPIRVKHKIQYRKNQAITGKSIDGNIYYATNVSRFLIVQKKLMFFSH